MPKMETNTGGGRGAVGDTECRQAGRAQCLPESLRMQPEGRPEPGPGGTRSQHDARGLTESAMASYARVLNWERLI